MDEILLKTLLKPEEIFQRASRNYPICNALNLAVVRFFELFSQTDIPFCGVQCSCTAHSRVEIHFGHWNHTLSNIENLPVALAPTF